MSPEPPPAPSSSRFEVLPGGRRVAASFAGLHIVVAPEDDPPFGVDAVACEEDTWLALSADPHMVRAPAHPIRVMTRVWEARPERPGSVVLQRGAPLRLLAVVHDLDAEPTWRAEWVEAALDGILDAAAEARLRSIALPLLATRYGGLEPLRFMQMLRRRLDRHHAADGGDGALQRIWLVRGTETGADLLGALAG